MIQRLKYRLFASASSLVAAMILLPAGCMGGSPDECTIGHNTCADEHTALICTGSEVGFHFTSSPCEAELHCEASLGTATCMGAREGESCVTPNGCFDQPFCLDGKCSPVPPAVMSACGAAVELDMPTRQHEPDGAMIESTLEPGEAIVVPGLAVDASDSRAKPCGPMSDGPERVIVIHVPVTLGNVGPLHLEVKVKSLDSSLNTLAGIALGACGDPRTYLERTCAQQPSSSGLTIDFPISAMAQDITVVLQATEPLTAAVPFTLRAKLVVINPL